MIKSNLIIFLENKNFSKSIFNRRNNKLRLSLENLGIKVININEYEIDENIYYDDNNIPRLKTLYLYLSNNRYYNDKLFSKKKLDQEREMLFLIACKLGVKEINYNIEISEIKIKKLLLNSNIKK